MGFAGLRSGRCSRSGPIVLEESTDATLVEAEAAIVITRIVAVVEVGRGDVFETVEFVLFVSGRIDERQRVVGDVGVAVEALGGVGELHEGVRAEKPSQHQPVFGAVHKLPKPAPVASQAVPDHQQRPGNMPVSAKPRAIQ